MNQTKKIIITTVIILILIQGFFLLGSLFLWIGNLFADAGDIANARNWYTIASKYSPLEHERMLANYNLSRLSYIEKKYEESLKLLEHFIPNENLESFSKWHNLWNALYFLWDTANNTEQKITLWKQSLEAFSGALAIESNPETKANYEFVLEKLQKLEKEKQQQDEKRNESSSESEDTQQDGGSGSQNESQKNGSGSENKSQSGSQSEEQTGSGETKTWSSVGSYNTVWSGSTSENLTEDQKKQLDEYLKNMQNESKILQQFFRQGKPLENNANGINSMIQNFFGNDPFFQDKIENNGKRDW